MVSSLGLKFLMKKEALTLALRPGLIDLEFRRALAPNQIQTETLPPIALEENIL